MYRLLLIIGLLLGYSLNPICQADSSYIQSIVKKVSSLEDYDEAQKLIETTLEQKKDFLNTDSVLLASLYHKLGVIYFSSGETEYHYNNALKAYEKALKIRKGNLPKTNEKYLHTLYNIFVLHNHFFKNESAKSVGELLIEKLKRKKNQDSLKLIETYSQMGKLFLNTGDFRTSLDYFQAAISLTTEGANPSKLPEFYDYLGRVHSDLNQYDLAMEAYQNGIKIATDLEGQEENMGILLNELGMLYMDKKMYNKAITNFVESKSIFDQLYSVNKHYYLHIYIYIYS